MLAPMAAALMALLNYGNAKRPMLLWERIPAARAHYLWASRAAHSIAAYSAALRATPAASPVRKLVQNVESAVRQLHENRCGESRAFQAKSLFDPRFRTERSDRKSSGRSTRCRQSRGM